MIQLSMVQLECAEFSLAGLAPFHLVLLFYIYPPFLSLFTVNRSLHAISQIIHTWLPCRLLVSFGTNSYLCLLFFYYYLFLGGSSACWGVWLCCSHGFGSQGCTGVSMEVMQGIKVFVSSWYTRFTFWCSQVFSVVLYRTCNL